MKYIELFKICPHVIKGRNYKCFRILEIWYAAFELEKLEKMESSSLNIMGEQDKNPFGRYYNSY